MFLSPPVRWVSGPLVYSENLDDAWAVFRLPTTSYGGIGVDRKKQLFYSVVDFCFDVRADFQILRAGGFWNTADYRSSMRDTTIGEPHRSLRDAYVDAQAAQLGDRGASVPHVFLSVSLKPARTSASEALSGLVSSTNGNGGWASWLKSRLKVGRGDGEISFERFAEHHYQARLLEEKFSQRFYGCRLATSGEVRWLIERSFNRGSGTPEVDNATETEALLIERDGKERVVPSVADVGAGGGFSLYRDRLLVGGDLGLGLQAGLAVRRMPRYGQAPDDALELMFRPAERLDFPLDLALSCRWVSNSRAVSELDRRIKRSDRDAENEGGRGLEPEVYDRQTLSRALKQTLKQTGSPLLESQLTMICSAPVSDDSDPEVLRAARETLNSRVEQVKQTFRDFDCVVYRPSFEQADIFCAHFPGQPPRLHNYTRRLLPENVASFAPTASHSFGTEHGWLLGRTSSQNPSPVRFDIRTGSRLNRKTAIALIGEQGSGKTLTQQKLMREGFYDGARIVDIDGKGDHHLWKDPDLNGHVEEIRLEIDRPELKGLLDPLVIAPKTLKHNAALDALCSLLPKDSPAAWEGAVTIALHRVAKVENNPTTTHVLRALKAGDRTGQEVASVLETHADNGLGRLMFATPGSDRQRLGEKQVTHIITRDLPLPKREVARSDYTSSERAGDQIQRLISLLSRRLLADYPDQLKIANSDEAWQQLQTSQGKSDFETLQRLGRSELCVPILGTQLPSDLEVGVADLFGVILVFRVESKDEQAHALRLLGLDPEDQAAKDRIKGLADGECLAKSYSGSEIEWIQIEHVDRTLSQINTNPLTRQRSHDHDLPR